MPFVTKARKKNDPVLRNPTTGLNQAEQKMYDIYFSALGKMRNDLNDQNVIRNIRGAVEAGNPLDGGVAFKWQEFIASLENSVPQLAQQVANSANISAKSLPKSIKISTSFDAVDPRAIAWAQQRAGARISGIVKESQKAVAEVIANGLRTKLTREQVVRQITEIVGLDTRQAKALANFYEKNLQDLLEDGMTFEQAEREALKLSKEYRKRLLAQRATRIARTETLAAANAGRMLSWAEADRQGLLPSNSVKRWKTATDERTCPVCGPMHNVSVQWQGTFSTGDLMPPNHPNCRCTAVIIPGEPIYNQNLNKSLEKRYYRFADGEKTWRNYDYKWRKIATELKRKVGKCERCGSKSNLTVDHKKRLRDGGAKYDRKNLRVLCRSCNGGLSRLGTKLRKDSNSWLFAKHGTHDQKTHGRRGGNSASTGAMMAFNDRNYREVDDWSSDEFQEVTVAYKAQYTANTEDNVSAEFQVQNYATSGYQGINAVARGQQASDTFVENKISVLDKTIEQSPDLVGDKNLYRVTSDRLLADLQPGDTFVDKGFMSTTRTNLTDDMALRNELGDLSSGNNTVTIILPSPSRTGKGLAVDAFLATRGQDRMDDLWGREKEILLPRNTALLFIGISETTDSNGKPIAIFQRTDK